MIVLHLLLKTYTIFSCLCMRVHESNQIQTSHHLKNVALVVLIIVVSNLFSFL